MVLMALAGSDVYVGLGLLVLGSVLLCIAGCWVLRCVLWVTIV